MSARDGGRGRPAWAEVDLAAVRNNVAYMAAVAAPARLCAVVKAGGYGHGAVEVARAALEGGADWLAVALVEEGIELREAGIDAPVLLLSQPPAGDMVDAVRDLLTPTIDTEEGLDALASAVPEGSTYRVHVKVDTGMHRVGAAPSDALGLVKALAARPGLVLEGVWTHLASADEEGNPSSAAQLDLFEDTLEGLPARPPLVHAANSSGTLWHPRARQDMVRCGITLYGLAPSAARVGDAALAPVRPALSLHARVTHAKELRAGERISYGGRYTLGADSVVATVPLGYADGVPRSLSAAGGEALVRGRRVPMAGTITMDQLMLDCGTGADVVVGDEVVLVGSQGDETVTAWDWARMTGTIAYEITCGLAARVPRVYVGASG